MLRLTVVSPCEEPWDRMTPTATGRHCAACAREVIDFTTMTEARATAHALLFDGGRMCGRVAYDLEGAPVYRPETPPGGSSSPARPAGSSPHPRPGRAAALAAVFAAATGCIEVPPPTPETPPQPPAKLLHVAEPELAVVTKQEPPPADADNDGIPDKDDACPYEPGQASDQQDKNGCRTFVGIVVQGDIQILQHVQFAAGSAAALKESQPILDEIAKVMTEHPEIKRVRIEGHASTDEKNAKALSEKRAKAVMDALIKAGVDAGRLETSGYGAERPIADGVTKEGRERNRRIDFVIVDNGSGSI